MTSDAMLIDCTGPATGESIEIPAWVLAGGQISTHAPPSPPAPAGARESLVCLLREANESSRAVLVDVREIRRRLES